MNFATTEPGGDRILIEATFPTPPSRVFRAWTDPDEVKKWFGSDPGTLESANIDLRPGGRWRFTETTAAAGSVGFEGHYVEIEPDTALAFSWSKFTDNGSGERQTTPPSLVEVHFTPTLEGTHMTIVHSALDNAQVQADFLHGWKRALPNLAAII